MAKRKKRQSVAVGDATTEKRTQLVGQFLKLEDEAMIEVFEAVFAQRTPYPMEQAWFKNRYFLGTATSLSLSRGDQPVAGTWSQWELGAIAYVDKTEFPNSAWGPGFRQFGTCPYCHIKVACNASSGLCPVCGTKCKLSDGSSGVPKPRYAVVIDDVKRQNIGALASQFLELEDEEMIEVLRELFALRKPYKRRQTHRSHYFLGVATSGSLSGMPLPVAGPWGQWELSAIAYLDKERYPHGMWGPSFCQFGACPYCRTDVACNAKDGFCPICGTECGLT